MLNFVKYYKAPVSVFIGVITIAWLLLEPFNMHEKFLPTLGGWRYMILILIAVCISLVVLIAKLNSIQEKLLEEKAILVSIQEGRTKGDRTNSYEEILSNAKRNSTILILGRSLVDWSDFWEQMEFQIREKQLSIKLALLDENSHNDIEPPSPSEWAYQDVKISMDRLRRIKIQSNTGNLEIYGLNFYLPHSFIAYTNKKDNCRHCIEEAGMALPKSQRPYFEVKSNPNSHFGYAERLETLYSSVLTKNRLILSDDGQNRIDNSVEKRKRIQADTARLIDQQQTYYLKMAIRAALGKWSNPDLLRGSWGRIVKEKSIKVFEAIYKAHHLPMPSPVSLHYEVTNHCNSKCNHCQRWQWQNGNDPSIDTANSILEIGSRLGVETITIGGGEPLLYPNLDKLLAKSKQLGIHAGLITNGLSIHDRMLTSLCDNTDWIRFSIDGADNKAYGLVRNIQDGFDIVTNNVKRVVKHRNSLNIKQPAMGLNFVIQKHNFKQINDIMQFAGEMGIDFIIFKLIHGDNNSNISSSELDELSNTLSGINEHDFKINNNITQLKQMILEDFQQDDIVNGKPTKSFYAEKKTKCFAPFFFLTVDPRGNIYPCDYLLYDTRSKDQFESCRAKYNMGRLLDLESPSVSMTNKISSTLEDIHSIDVNRIPECGCCTRFYRFNSLMCELYDEYHKFCTIYPTTNVNQIFQNLLNNEIAIDKYCWL